MNDVQIIQQSTASDLGQNAVRLNELISTKENSVFVDIGVREGMSSGVMGINSKGRGNKVYGVDVSWDNLNHGMIQNADYYQLTGDSSTIGKYAELEDLKGISVLFIDSLHVKEQVLCELFYWVPRLKKGSTVVFHDSHWADGQHAVINGKSWPRVDEAIREFFGLTTLEDYEDDNIKVECYPESYGMTFVTLKKFNKGIKRPTSVDWETTFQQRNELISQYWNEGSVGDRTIELEMTYEVN
jgi:cephalosporin hydroxylase